MKLNGKDTRAMVTNTVLETIKFYSAIKLYNSVCGGCIIRVNVQSQ